MRLLNSGGESHAHNEQKSAQAAAAVSFVGYLIAGFVKNVFICLPITLGIMLVVILVIKKFVNNAAEHHAEMNA